MPAEIAFHDQIAFIYSLKGYLKYQHIPEIISTLIQYTALELLQLKYKTPLITTPWNR